jgi:hypothetical protein
LAGMLVVAGFVLVTVLDHLQSGNHPLLKFIWKPVQRVDVIEEKAAAME